MSSRCTDSSDLGIFLAVFPREARPYSGLAFLYFLGKKMTMCECVGTLIVVLGWALQNKSMGFSSTVKWVSGVTPQCSPC